MLYQYLTENFKPNEPIFANDITIEDMSEENLRYHLKELTRKGKLCRFEQGVYYLPKQDVFGERMTLSADQVAYCKYICRNGKPIGYYSGYTLANRMGLSTQVPMKAEIVSNAAPAQVRDVKIGGRTFTIRRPIFDVNADNVYALQLLDSLKDYDKCSEMEPKDGGAVLVEFMKRHNIEKQMVDALLGLYPLKVYKAMYETGVAHVFT